MSDLDRELSAAIDQEMASAQGVDTSKISEQRSEAMERYYGGPYGNESEDRSNVTTREVMDTVEWIKPELMKLFASGGDTVRFTPQGPDDVEQAAQETDYVNYQFHQKNPGFTITYQWITDGLLQKNGIVKAYYDDAPQEQREDYNGITENQMLMILAEDNVELIERREYDDPDAVRQAKMASEALRKQAQSIQDELPKRQQAIRQQMMQVPPEQRAQVDALYQQLAQQAQARVRQIAQQMQQLQQQPIPKLYDISVRVTTEGKGLTVVNVPPEEFSIAADARCIPSSRFCCHEREITRSELVEMGYDRDLIELLPSGNSQTYMREERIARHSYDDTDEFRNPQTGANDTVWLQEAYIRYDYDDDGIAELRRVVKVGKEILENEEVNCMPFASWTPIIISHKFYGLSIADIVMDLQKIKTQLFRNILDNQYLSNNGRYEVVENMVNYEDLMESRTHGMVRVKTPGAVRRLDTPQLSPTAFQMLQYVDYLRERRTGVSERTQGLDENQLNSNTAASAVNQVMTAAQQRIELIARVFAETGLADLFKLMHRLICQNTRKSEVVQLRGSYVEVNPATWRTRTETQVVVGLGNGSRDSEMAKMGMVFQQQMQLLSNPQTAPIVQPTNVYNLLEDQVKVINKASTGRYFSDPSSAQAQQVQQMQQQIMQLTQQLQQMQQEMQQGLQARAVAVEEFKARKNDENKKAEIAIKQDAQALDEQAHEDEVALNTAELALEQEQDRNVVIG